jgi:transcriptional regulator with XRE-family HTH domain
MNTLQTFGDRVKELREEKGLTTRALGEILEIGNSTVSRYETYQRIPNIIVLQKYCTYFKVSSDYLIGLTNIK